MGCTSEKFGEGNIRWSIEYHWRQAEIVRVLGKRAGIRGGDGAAHIAELYAEDSNPYCCAQLCAHYAPTVHPLFVFHLYCLAEHCKSGTVFGRCCNARPNVRERRLQQQSAVAYENRVLGLLRTYHAALIRSHTATC